MALAHAERLPGSAGSFMRRSGSEMRRSAARLFCSMPSRGLGDTIQFIRYAPLLAGMGAKVVCEVQPELQPLLAQLQDLTIIASGEPLPAFDLHCPLLSLPLAFGTQARDDPGGGSVPRGLGGAAGRVARSFAVDRTARGKTARRICLVRPTLAQE